jgi:hypothetical protein
MRALTILLPLLCLPVLVSGQANYDESKVTPYRLPEVLQTFSGERVSSKKEWEKYRRPEILEAFRKEVYGRTPEQKLPVRYEVISEDLNAMGGKAIRKEIMACFSDATEHCVAILLILPKTNRPVPVFLGLNYEGNHAVFADPGIRLNTRWMRRTDLRGVVNHHATEASRGALYGRWEVEKLVDRGYGLVTVYQGDFELDRKDRSGTDGIRNLLPRLEADEEWGSIGVWSWGLSRVMDYLETDRRIDAKKVSLVGHSRLGKTALWAGAQDTRFAMVISNNSGEGGASLSRRNYGETIADLNRAVSYWFCPNYKKYNEDPSKLPVDAHLLISLMAPRPVYVASATEDQWADPKGEYLAAYHAGPAYGLYGKKGFDSPDIPAPETPVASEAVGYHLRTGAHDINAYDWDNFLNFADRYFKRKKK